MSKIYLNGYIDVPLDRLDDVTEALIKHKRLTREEDGCLSFEVDPCPQVAGRFLVSEIFVDKEAFVAHQVRTKASDWGRVTKGMPRHYTVEEK